MADSAYMPTVEVYRWPCGRTMRREDGTCPVGNAFNGCWVMREADGTFIDYDRYRHDIMPRHGMANIEPHDEPDPVSA